MQNRPLAGTGIDLSAGLANSLAASRDGCTETLMLAHGFTVQMLLELMHAGLATATTEPVAAPDYRGERTRVRITEAGRQRLVGDASKKSLRRPVLS